MAGVFSNCILSRTALYYAVKLIPTFVANYDGLRVNVQFEVLRADGTVVPNLYCGGEAAHTGAYSTLAAALFSGRLIGEEAAAAILGN